MYVSQATGTFVRRKEMRKLHRQEMASIES